MIATHRVRPSARELQFIDATVGFGATGNMPETKKHVRQRIAMVLMTFPQTLPRKNGGAFGILP
jgi:hypothetical protein